MVFLLATNSKGQNQHLCDLTSVKSIVFPKVDFVRHCYKIAAFGNRVYLGNVYTTYNQKSVEPFMYIGIYLQTRQYYDICDRPTSVDNISRPINLLGSVKQ